MATTTDFVTTLQNQYLENVRRSQQAVVEAIGSWAESFDKLVPDASARTVAGKFPSAEEVIDNSFDFANSLLAAQRQFAKSVWSVTASGVSQAQAKAEPERTATSERSTRK